MISALSKSSSAGISLWHSPRAPAAQHLPAFSAKLSPPTHLSQAQFTLSVSPRPSELLLPSLLSDAAASPVGVGGVEPQPPRGRLPGSR